MRRCPTVVRCALVGAAVVLLAAACAGSSTDDRSAQPLPTIGLGSDLSSDDTGSDEAGVERIIAASAAEIDTVVMIGDSITVASRPALEQVLGRFDFDDVDIQAQESKRTATGSASNPSGSDIAAAYVSITAAERADDDDDRSDELWIVALGTNDISQYDEVAELAAAIDEMLDQVPDDAPLIWVDTYYRDRPDDAAQVNAAITERLSERGNATTARWSAVADDDGNLRDDGVHPREQGTVVFADVVGNAIIDFLGGS